MMHGQKHIKLTRRMFITEREMVTAVLENNRFQFLNTHESHKYSV